MIITMRHFMEHIIHIYEYFNFFKFPNICLPQYILICSWSHLGLFWCDAIKLYFEEREIWWNTVPTFSTQTQIQPYFLVQYFYSPYIFFFWLVGLVWFLIKCFKAKIFEDYCFSVLSTSYNQFNNQFISSLVYFQNSCLRQSIPLI